jgi:hypothetical protein
MRLKCIGCEALARMVYVCAAHSPHTVDIEILKLGLHNSPDDLRTHLQHLVDQAASQKYDAVVLAYGLCGKATDGLIARSIPIVLPRCHDCITLFLGSRSRYNEQFGLNPGTYWYAFDYIQRNESPGTTLSPSTGMGVDMAELYKEYVTKYGEDNADYLMEVMGAWQKHYNRAVYIDMGVGDGSQVEKQASDDAQRRGWTFERMEGDIILIRKLLDGIWDKDFLVLQPGQHFRMTYDDTVVAAESAQG